jgi:hypothetical protein
MQASIAVLSLPVYSIKCCISCLLKNNEVLQKFQRWQLRRLLVHPSVYFANLEKENRKYNFLFIGLGCTWGLNSVLDN